MEVGDVMPPNTPFTLDGVTWKGLLNGRVIPGEFGSRDAALHGMAVEKQRREFMCNVRYQTNSPIEHVIQRLKSS